MTTISTVKIIPNDKSNPPGKLADAELHFADGALDGLKLIGFAVWERRTGGGRNVTFPARQYAVNGERRSFALLRPIADTTAQDRIRTLILDAYAQHEGAEQQDDMWICPSCGATMLHWQKDDHRHDAPTDSAAQSGAAGLF